MGVLMGWLRHPGTANDHPQRMIKKQQHHQATTHMLMLVLVRMLLLMPMPMPMLMTLRCDQ